MVGLSATAKKGVNDPDLPGFSIYWADGKILRKINDFDIRFSRWDDYGSYLGNDHDFGNNFAKTPTISFVIGAQISNDYLDKKPLYIVGTVSGCVHRSYERFRNPPVSYAGICSDLSDALSIDDLTRLALVRRID